MTLAQKVGQIMIIGFDGTTFDPGLRTMIERHHIGGVIFFARNVESPAQVAGLTNTLQRSALEAGGVGLFTAIDQEGGRVARLTTAKGFTEFPGAMALGATARNVSVAAENAGRVARVMAAEMKAVGLNVNFAPDIDVNNNPANPVIGIRSYSSDPQRVAALGRAAVDGLQGQGVLAFGKHFPGHGDTAVDSHAELPVVSHARSRLDAVEFVPFRAVIDGKIAGIMTAHVSFPAIEATPGVPGTLSSKVLTDLLRRDLGYDGLVVTDSLEMGALGRSGFPPPRAAARALQAGADLLLFNAGFALHTAAIELIVAEVATGKIPLARLDEAVRRVLRAKANFGLWQPAAADATRAAEIVGAPAHRALSLEIASKAVTLVRDDRGVLPLPSGVAPIVLAVPGAAGLAAGLGGTEVKVAERPTESDIAAALQAVRAKPGAPVIVTLAGAGPNSPQIELARRVIASGSPTIVIALREPYDLLSLGTAGQGGPALVATYGMNPATLQALVAMLRGEAMPAGHLPVELPGLYPLGTGLESFTRK